MSQPNFNSNIYSNPTNSWGPVVFHSRSPLVARSSDATIIHLSRLRLLENARAYTTTRSTSSCLNAIQRQTGRLNGASRNFFSIDEREIAPGTLHEANQSNGEQDALIQFLKEWAADLSVCVEVRMQRFAVYKKIASWLEAQDFLLTVQWNVLPNIFHTKLMQARLRSLIIECPSTLLGSAIDVLELPELKGNLTQLESLCISGAGVTSLTESLGMLSRLTSLWVIHTRVSQLPESLGDLVGLETLKITENSQLTHLPNSLVRLSNLKTLNLDGCSVLSHLPDAHHCHSRQDLSDDGSRRFGNLSRLTELSLSRCVKLERLPASLCTLGILRVLFLADCHALTEFPEAIGAIESLLGFCFSRTPVESIPTSLYQLALKRKDFLPSPWNQNVQWMLQAVHGISKPYSINVNRNELCIVIKFETLVPYAREHLMLLVDALEEHGLIRPPLCVFVRYEGEEAIDQGGVTRDFFTRIFSNLVLQTKENHPTLTYAEERGYYVLEKEKGASRRLEDVQLCQNIGKLLCALACGLGKKCKIGNVFPKHVYAYLLWNVFFREGLFKPSLTFEEMPLKEQALLCRDLASLDENGIKDKEGNLLFQQKYFHEELCAMGFQDFRKLWILMHAITEEAELKRMFPHLSKQGFIFDGEEDERIENKELFVDAFMRDILYTQTKQFIDCTLTHYAMQQYSRQCEALNDVMHGFKGTLGNRNRLFQVLEKFCGKDLQSAAHAFSLVIQGPPFTRSAFEGLMNCVIDSSVPAAMHEAIKIRMHVIKEEYLMLPDNKETQEQMKRMVRCILGSEVIMPNKKLMVYEPRVRNHTLENHALELEPKSIFHTCSGSVEVGNELMTQDITTLEGRKKLFAIWLNHLTEALGIVKGLGTGFSLA